MFAGAFDGFDRRRKGRPLIAPFQPQPAGGVPRWGLERADQRILQAEMLLGASLVAIIFLLMPLNAVLRYAGQPLLWVDEFTLQLMVWLAFLGASIGIATGQHMAIGLLAAKLPPRARRGLRILCDVLVLIFLGVMVWLAWLWFDPVGLWQRGGDVGLLAQETFNFTYTEPSLTLGLRKLWFWLFVPLSLIGAVFHALTVLVRDLCGQGDTA